MCAHAQMFDCEIKSLIIFRASFFDSFSIVEIKETEQNDLRARDREEILAKIGHSVIEEYYTICTSQLQ